MIIEFAAKVQISWRREMHTHTVEVKRIAITTYQFWQRVVVIYLVSWL